MKNFGFHINLLLIEEFIGTSQNFIIKVKESTGQVKTYIVEVKPKKQTKPPTSKSSPFDVKTYAINEAKWKAAKEFCDDRRIGFKIITEEELGIKYVAKNRRTK